MATREPLDLDAALRRAGAHPAAGAYESVAVRPVPAWLRRLWGSDTAAMALPRVVFVAPKAFEGIVDGADPGLLIHEATHVDQWRDHGFVGFIVRYLGDYLLGRAVGLPHRTAYRSIRFEREAAERTERR